VKAAYALVTLALAVLVAVAAGASAQAESPTRASALAVRVSTPAGELAASERLLGPPAVQSDPAAWRYPADGSVVDIGAASAGVAAQSGESASAQAIATAQSVSLLGGAVTVQSVVGRTSSAAGVATSTADISSSSLSGLAVLGQPVEPGVNQQLPLADWGTLDVLAGTLESGKEPRPTATGRVTGLRLRLIADYGGLPAGSVIELAVVEAVAEAELAPPPPPPAPAPRPAPTATPPAPRTGPLPPGPVAPAGTGRLKQPAPPPTPVQVKEPGRSLPGGAPARLVRPVPSGVVSRFSAAGYVFPVFGPVSFGDSFGFPRGAYVGGWHHGEDIFAPAGAPILAVADGTIFSVGWNQYGGWRLWLRDRVGNQFYYAHLSAYSPLAVDGQEVRAGDVIGFMGNTGDAEFSPPHLHFEIHPVQLLPLGYDGVVAPYPFLVAWRRAQDVSFDAGRKYLPEDGPTRGRNVAPQVGAVLLEASDISAASGLDPGALERTLARRSAGAPSLAVPGAG
jgi:murein DD-endopeptidase MepM/ murein hydrolase activator NlpD